MYYYMVDFTCKLANGGQCGEALFYELPPRTATNPKERRDGCHSRRSLHSLLGSDYVGNELVSYFVHIL